jgi:hypothetical protein
VAKNKKNDFIYRTILFSENFDIQYWDEKERKQQKKLPGTWKKEAAILGPGKRNQQKKLPGTWKQLEKLPVTWETEVAKKASWHLGNGSSRESFLGPGKRK